MSLNDCTRCMHSPELDRVGAYPEMDFSGNYQYSCGCGRAGELMPTEAEAAADWNRLTLNARAFGFLERMSEPGAPVNPPMWIEEARCLVAAASGVEA